MSENIPFEIQMDIVERIPDTKWVVQYRSVSKAWKSVIDSKDFVTAHTLRHHQANRHHLLIRTEACETCKDCTGTITSGHCDRCNFTRVKYISIVDDDTTFPHQKVTVLVPDSVKKLTSDDIIILGSSHGLFCLYERGRGDTVVIWNPSIGKTVVIPVPNVLCGHNCRTVVGFGVCPRNVDAKVVKITYLYDISELQDDVNASTQVEVFSLSSGGTWRSPLSSDIPHKSVGFGHFHAVIDGFIYWDALDNVGGGSRRNHYLIMSFDLTSEEFTKVDLPDSLALNHDALMRLSNLRGSLAILELKFYFNGDFNSTGICQVWQMIGHGCTRSFNKLYSVNAHDASIHTALGFRKSVALIIEVDNDKEDCYKYERALAMYEPESKSNTNIRIYGLYGTFCVHSYMETLLLLGH